MFCLFHVALRVGWVTYLTNTQSLISTKLDTVIKVKFDTIIEVRDTTLLVPVHIPGETISVGVPYAVLQRIEDTAYVSTTFATARAYVRSDSVILELIQTDTVLDISVRLQGALRDISYYRDSIVEIRKKETLTVERLSRMTKILYWAAGVVVFMLIVWVVFKVIKR